MTIKRQTMITKRVVAAMTLVLSSAVIAFLSAAQAADTQPIGDAAKGKILYQACESCHSIDDNDIGPKHRGVVGRVAGSVSDYAYSAALKNSGIVWNEVTLDRWLTNPSAMVPGTKMFFKIDSAQERADIIAFLKEQKTAK